jgi:DMSO/TMAO reductase YedYZ molybdopterin-dependent catalytic subunit
MKTIAPIIILLLGIASGQTNGQPETAAGRISGRIVTQFGAALSNIPVRLRGAPPDETRFVLYTAQDGTFSFPVEPRKKYNLNVVVPGFAVTTRTIETGPGKEVKLGDISMSVGSSSGVLRDQTFFVEGIAGTTATFSTDDLATLPQQTVKTTDHGSVVTFQGVLLSDVLSKVETPAGEMQLVTGPAGVERHSTAKSYYVLVGGKDGYRTVFAWAELDPAFIDKAVYLVTKRDGKPLSDKEGPVRLVAPGEKKAGRWARQVTSISIRRAD